jgi:hypothetical protein
VKRHHLSDLIRSEGEITINGFYDDNASSAADCIVDGMTPGRLIEVDGGGYIVRGHLVGDVETRDEVGDDGEPTTTFCVDAAADSYRRLTFWERAWRRAKRMVRR